MALPVEWEGTRRSGWDQKRLGGTEYKRGVGCAVLYMRVSTISRVTVRTASVSSVKAISTTVSIQRASYVGPTARMYTYV